MQPLIVFLGIVYAACTLLLMGYGAATLLLVLLYLFHHARDRNAPAPPLPATWPTVLVQLPIYNEAHVIHRLIDAVAALDYPRDRLSVQVLDDSTDHTTGLVRAHVEKHRAAGLDITHIRRPDRSGFKAGALAYGLAHSAADLVAVFDADFLPAPGFLRQTVPALLANARTGVVQARWEHLNSTRSLLTRAQALSIDMHFTVEQYARSRAGLTLNFSGSAGIWRRACIEDAGGWRAVTLTEDLDLSYRAQLCDWRVALLPMVAVPAELPPQVAAYKRQQARWAKGSTQCLRLHGRAILRAGMNPLKKLMALAHLGQYLIHPLLLLLMLLAVPLTLTDVLQHTSLSLLGVLGLAPVVAFALSQRALYCHWAARLLVLPAIILLSAGVTLSNTLAVLAALAGRPNVFQRTPKFGAGRWVSSGYALLADKTVLGELALAAYAAVGAALAVIYDKPAALPIFVTYTLACGGMALLTLWDNIRVMRAPREDAGKPSSSRAV
ncbi:MAG: glycosyltransferase [Anaerolineae bacterium]|nr:glycosyltransferase [Anaerolineae bacterium]